MHNKLTCSKDTFSGQIRVLVRVRSFTQVIQIRKVLHSLQVVNKVDLGSSYVVDQFIMFHAPHFLDFTKGIPHIMP